MNVGKSVVRVDAFDKATGRAKYTDDLCDKSALILRVVRSTIAHGFVKSVDISEAMKVPGVVRIFTCFDRRSPVVSRGCASGRRRPPSAEHPCALLR